MKCLSATPLTLVTFASLFLLQTYSSSALIKKETSYITINFDPELLNEESKRRSESDEKFESSDDSFSDEEIQEEIKVPSLKTEDFIQLKNNYRAESYAKAAAGGVKDWRKSTKEGIQLGFAKKKTNEEEVNAEKKLVCYYAMPTVNDMPYPVFPEQIEPQLCTHILVAFARVANESVVFNDPRDEEFYNRTLKLKLKNPNLKVMLSIGSSNINDRAGRNDFATMMASNETRLRFVKNSLEFMEKYKFDGLDVDWEFPCWDGPLAQKHQLSLLFEQYRGVMQQYNISAILSAAVPSPKQIVDIGYDIRSLAKTLDFINLMTYDFHMYAWYSPLTGPNSPLFQESEEFGYLITLNTAWAANYWYQNGMDASKIIVGIPTYGRSYRLVDKRNHDSYSLAIDVGTVGMGGYASYPDICKFMEGNGTTMVFNNESRVPYTYRDREWVSFENEQSALEKTRWIKKNGFGGVMIWCINNDDAYKLCNSSRTTFPIVRTARTELFSLVQETDSNHKN